MMDRGCIKWWLPVGTILLLLCGSVYQSNTSDSSFSSILERNGFRVSVNQRKIRLVGFNIVTPIREYAVASTDKARFSNEVSKAISNASGDILVLNCPDLAVPCSVLQAISERRELGWLNLGDLDCTAAPQIVFGKLDSLKSLSLHGRAWNDFSRPSFIAMPLLKKLDLAQTDVADRTFVELARLKSLQQLRMARTLISDASISSLSSEMDETMFPELDALFVDQCKLTDSFAQFAGRLPHLKVLDVSYTMVTDAGVREILASCPNLESLFLDGCDLDGISWCNAPWPHGLTCVTVQGTRLDGNTIIRMCEAHPTLLTVLYGDCGVSAVESREIAALLIPRNVKDGQPELTKNSLTENE
jgi:hypothetical protein